MAYCFSLKPYLVYQIFARAKHTSVLGLINIRSWFIRLDVCVWMINRRFFFSRRHLLYLCLVIYVNMFKKFKEYLTIK